MPVLEHNKLVGLQVADISRPGRYFFPEDDPTHVRPEKPFICAVRIKFGVSVAMMSTMLPRPPEGGPLGCRSTAYEQE